MLTMSWAALFVLIVIAAVCGTIARALLGSRGGLVTSIALGFIGALVGPWLAHQLHLSEPLVLNVSGRPFPVLWSVIGATLCLAILHLLTRRRSWV